MKKLYENKKIIFIIGGCLLIVLLAIFVSSLGPSEKKMNKNIKEMAASFYENYYWKHVGKISKNRKDYLEQYKEKGFKFDLSVLEKIDDNSFKKVSSMVNKRKCVKSKTKAIVYPKEPYGKKDYTLEVVLECR